jgi:predicted helicase
MLAVCCDGTVSAESGDDSDDLSTSQLVKTTGISVTTDPDLVAQFLSKRGPSVIFSTYASSEVIESAQQNRKCPAFSLAICDEAHRCASHLNGSWATILRKDAIKAKKRLFMTATPRIYRIAREDEDDVVASMDDKKIFGPVFYKLSFSEAVRRKLLCDYRVVVTVVTDKDVAKAIKSGKHIKVSGNEFKARDLAIHIAVDKAAKEHKLKKIISFHSRIYKAKEFNHKHRMAIKVSGSTTNVNKVWTSHMSASFDSQERLKILEEFESQPKKIRALLTNARCLTEGVDVPSVDGVVFADPRESVIAITQAIGRAMRTAPGKKYGYIVIPVFAEDSKVNKVNNDYVWDNALSDSSFHTVHRVMLALRSQDDEMEDMLSKITMKSISNSVNNNNVQTGPRYVTKEEFYIGIKSGKMVEASENDNNVEKVKGGRVFDNKNREIVLRIPDRFLTSSFKSFSSSITNKIVKWNTPKVDIMTLKLIDFIKKNKRMPKSNSRDYDECVLAKYVNPIRRLGKKFGYANS